MGRVLLADRRFFSLFLFLLEMSGLSFHIASLDESGVLNMWVSGTHSCSAPCIRGLREWHLQPSGGDSAGRACDGALGQSGCPRACRVLWDGWKWTRRGCPGAGLPRGGAEGHRCSEALTTDPSLRDRGGERRQQPEGAPSELGDHCGLEQVVFST